MKKIVIVSAMRQESAYVEEYIGRKDGWKKKDTDIYENKDFQLQIIVKILGVGKVNAAYQTADAINEHHPALIVNIGVAGGLAPGLERGAVAIGTDYVQTDMRPFLKENIPYIKETPEWISTGISEVAKEKGFSYREGRIATGDFCLFDGQKRQDIIDEFNPIAFDMETAAVAQVATAKGIDFAAIRIFSDLADEKTVHLLGKKEITDEKELTLRKKLNECPTILIIDFLEKYYK